jgi:hypothetical protein
MKKISLLFTILIIYSLNITLVQAQGLNILDFVGAWEGQWVNTTFGSQGAAHMKITADITQKTFQIVSDLDGNVLGGSDPDPITLEGTYTDTEFNITTTTTTFGDLTVTIDGQGNFSGSTVNLPNQNIERVDFNGGVTPETITINYTVTFSASIGGGTAVGVLTLNAVTPDYNNPESAVYDATNDCYYISNTGDGKIIRVDANDTNSKSVLSSDLTSIRGLCIIGNTLVAAADEGIVFIALPIGTIIQTVVIPGMLFLNDVTWDDSQYVYVSDTGTGMIYKIKIDDYTFSTLAVGINTPNGLFYDGANNRLICVPFIQNAPILTVSLPAGVVTSIRTTTLSNSDGIARNMFGEWYISYWGDNSVYRFNSDFSGDPVEVSSSQAGPADISFRTLTATGKVSNATEIQANTGILVIPNFNGNTVNFLNLTNLSNYETEVYIPQYFSLKQNYPNPFNPSTTIRYGLEKNSYVKVEIFDISGKLLSTLHNNNQTQGWHSVIWNGTNQKGKQMPAGLYLSKITVGNESKTTKMMLLK